MNPKTCWTRYGGSSNEFRHGILRSSQVAATSVGTSPKNSLSPSSSGTRISNGSTNSISGSSCSSGETATLIALVVVKMTQAVLCIAVAKVVVVWCT